MLYEFNAHGKRTYPRSRNKVFELRKYVLNPLYCQARPVGTKNWKIFATSWFVPVKRRKAR